MPLKVLTTRTSRTYKVVKDRRGNGTDILGVYKVGKAVIAGRAYRPSQVGLFGLIGADI